MRLAKRVVKPNKCKQQCVSEKVSATVRFPGRNIALLLVSALFGLMCGSAVAQTGQPSAGPEMPTEAEHSMFVKGQTLHNQGLYGEAILILSESLETFPNSSIKDLNLLWLGRSYLAQGDMTNAEKTELRLRAIPDSALLGIYEGELRRARQNYGRTVTPSPVRKSEPVNKPGPEAGKSLIVAPSPEPFAAARNKEPLKDLLAASPSVPGPPAGNGVAIPKSEELRAGIVVLNSNRPINKQESENRSTQWSAVEVRAALTSVLVAAPEELPAAKASTIAELPALRIRIEEIPKLNPGNGAFFYRLVITNVGKGIAKDLTVRGEMDGSLDYAGSDPLPSRQELVAQKQVLTFRLPTIEPGATKVLQISVRSRRGGKVNIATQTKHSVIYRDRKGSFYHTP